MDFSVYGYPLTFLTMAAVGLAVSARNLPEGGAEVP